MKMLTLQFAFGFVLLFFLYHSAEYFVLFTYQPGVFLAIQGLFFFTAWRLSKRLGLNGLAAWGLDTGKKWFPQLLTGLVTGVLLYLITFLLSLWAETETIIEVQSFWRAFPQTMLFFFGVFFSSLSEDILTRSYLFRYLNGKVSPVIFVLISSFVYLLNHLYRLNDGWQTTIYLLALGVLFALPLVITQRLWVTAGMHWFGNFTFYITHNIFILKTNQSALSPNLIFIGCIIVFIPVITKIVSKFWRFQPAATLKTADDSLLE